MENLSANSSVSYIELGDNNTLREATNLTPRQQTTLTRQRPGSETREVSLVANFDPENLRQLSSPTWNQMSARQKCLHVRRHLPLSMPTTQLSPDELSPLTSRLINDTPTDLVTSCLN
ncbi:hypothetical protein LSTR_LSTR009340 [Laodelphax striatellus]|uniref:Uncharacterized protein n=1 Tax=Laodelphax striatellus TaxID=195883 RepID=A0A482XIZ0_LAOST|nr:hypothetical protein LSTR_LSTR009340 [Laodelphax striatellus]